jgi:hypothetical protein
MCLFRRPSQRYLPSAPPMRCGARCREEPSRCGSPPFLQRYHMRREACQWLFRRGESASELPVPVIYIGGNRVGGPAAKELPNTLDGRPPTRLEDSIGGLPHARDRPWVLGRIPGRFAQVSGDSDVPYATISLIILRSNYVVLCYRRPSEIAHYAIDMVERSIARDDPVRVDIARKSRPRKATKPERGP